MARFRRDEGERFGLQRSKRPSGSHFAKSFDIGWPTAARRIVDFALHPIRDASGRSSSCIPRGSTLPSAEAGWKPDFARVSNDCARWLHRQIQSDDAIVSKNLDGIITSWNRGAERLFNYTADEAVGQPITIVIPPDRHDEERAI